MRGGDVTPISFSQLPHTFALNYAVSNGAERTVFSFLLLCNIALFFVTSDNLPRISRWTLQCRVCPNLLYCVNSNLYLLAIIRIMSFSYPLMANVLDKYHPHHDLLYQNTVIYQYLSHLSMIQLNMTLQIVSKNWLKMLNIKYRHRSTMLGLLSKLQTVLIFVLTLTSLIVVTVTCIRGDEYVYIQAQLNHFIRRSWIVISISILLTDTVFCYSCYVLHSSVKYLPRVSQRHKTILRYASLLLVLGSINRILFIFLRILDAELLQSMKGFDDVKLEDTSYLWAFLQLEFFVLTDFVPSMILAILFQPSPTKVDSVIASLIKIGTGSEATMQDSTLDK